MSFSGKRVLITDALSLKAIAAAELVLKAGAEAVLWHQDAAALDDLSERLRRLGSVRPMVVDITRPDQVRGAAAGMGTPDIILAFALSEVLTAEIQRRFSGVSQIFSDEGDFPPVSAFTGGPCFPG